MEGSSTPVMLVHGWNSHPGIWNRLIPRLEAAGIPYRRYDHTGLAGSPLPVIAENFGAYLKNEIPSLGADRIDIVCHSVGTCIARYLLEVIDGETRALPVRQLIGLGPPNNGSALAELFSSPEFGARIIDRLTGVFVPPGFDPSADPIVQDVRPKSPVMQALRKAGTRSDISYRVIVTANPGGISGFFPLFSGETIDIAGDGRVHMTRNGDGIVPNRESQLPGISLDILSPEPDGESGDGRKPLAPDQFCHISLPRNPVVIDRIMEYLSLPVPTKS